MSNRLSRSVVSLVALPITEGAVACTGATGRLVAR